MRGDMGGDGVGSCGPQEEERGWGKTSGGRNSNHKAKMQAIVTTPRQRPGMGGVKVVYVLPSFSSRGNKKVVS